MLNTDVSKRSEQVCLSQNTGIRHFIHELKEELVKLAQRQSYDNFDGVSQGSDSSSNHLHSKKLKEMSDEILANQRFVDLQNEEIAQLASKSDRLSGAAYYVALNEKKVQIRQKIKQLSSQKRKAEGEFKKEMYQGPARFFAEDYRRDAEALEKEFIEKKMKFARLKKEYEVFKEQNIEATKFLSEQKTHLAELNDRQQMLIKLAKHHDVKLTKDDESFTEDGKSKKQLARELQHKLELLQNCLPVIERNNFNQAESFQKEAIELKANAEKLTKVLNGLREKHKEIVNSIRGAITNTEKDKNTVIKLQRLLHASKTEDHGGLFREEAVNSSLDLNNLSSFFEVSNYTPNRLKHEISMELSHLAAIMAERNKDEVNRLSDQSTSPVTQKNLSKLDPNTNGSRKLISHFRKNQTKPLVRRTEQTRYKSVDRAAEIKEKPRVPSQETFRPPSKPILIANKNLNSEDGQSLMINDQSSKDADDTLDQKVKSVSPIASRAKNQYCFRY